MAVAVPLIGPVETTGKEVSTGDVNAAYVTVVGAPLEAGTVWTRVSVRRSAEIEQVVV